MILIVKNKEHMIELIDKRYEFTLITPNYISDNLYTFTYRKQRFYINEDCSQGAQVMRGSALDLALDNKKGFRLEVNISAHEYIGLYEDKNKE